VRTHLRKPENSDRGNILMFDKGVALDLRNESQRLLDQIVESIDPVTGPPYVANSYERAWRYCNLSSRHGVSYGM
jgi:hypothetical protein